MMRSALLAAAVAAGLGAGLAGCTTNPATGESAFTGGMSTADEVRAGRQYHPQIVAEFGGEYGGPELRQYFNSIGQLLAQTVERRDLAYTFTLLNSDIVNAFATPGGYVYITRGLLALCSDEAELAAVLAHELGHIQALHHARRHGQSVLAQVLLAGAGILTSQVAPQATRAVMDLGQIGALTVLQRYSRENEFEADDLGMRYGGRAGYDPAAMARFLAKLRQHSRFEAVLRGQSPDKVDEFDYMATHPAPIERIQRARANADAARIAEPIVAEELYLGKIDGMLYGDDPKQGLIRGSVFAHPELRFQFEVPNGFNLFNSPRAVLGIGPAQSRIVFDRAPRPSDGPMTFYLTQVWAPRTQLADLESITINGLEAATGRTRARLRSGETMDVRLVAIRSDLQTIYRFLFATPPSQTEALSVELRRATYSFRRLSEEEAGRLKPQMIKAVRVAPGDTVEGLAARMAFPDRQVERFRVLNGLAEGQSPRPGQLVKIVVE
jgi:predicted Zn-dependent protease